MKKTLSLLVAITMIVCSFVPLAVSAAEAGEFSNKICTITTQDGKFLGTPENDDKGTALALTDDETQWRFKLFVNDTYSFIGTNGLAADVNGASSEAGATIIEWTASGASNQRWTIEDAGDGLSYIKSVLSGLYMTETDGAVTQEEKDETKNQTWKITAVADYDPPVEKMLESDAAKALHPYRYERLCDYLLTGGEFNMLCYNKVETMIEERDYFNLPAEEQAAFIEECFDVVSTDLMYGSMATKETPLIEVVDTEMRKDQWMWYNKPSETVWAYTVDITDEESGETHTIIYLSVEPDDEDYAKLVGESVGCFEEPIRKELRTFYWTAADEGTWNGGGGEIWNNTNYRGDVNNMVQMFAHELGHVMDNGRIDNNVWLRAIAHDMVPVTGYGNTTRWEDLAEYSRMYLLARGDEDRIAAIEKTYPARTIAYKALLYAVDNEFYADYKDEYETATAPVGDLETVSYIKISLDGKYFTDRSGNLTLEDELGPEKAWQTWIAYEGAEGTSIVQNKATGRYLTFDGSTLGAKLIIEYDATTPIGFKSEGDGYTIASETEGFEIGKDLAMGIDDGAVFEIEEVEPLPYVGEYQLVLSSLGGDNLAYFEKTVENPDGEQGEEPVTEMVLGVNGDEYVWEIVPADRGYYSLRDKESGKYLDISGGSMENGAKAILYQQTGGWNQQFAIESTGDGTYSLVMRHSGLKLAFKDGEICQGDGKGYYTRWTLNAK